MVVYCCCSLLPSRGAVTLLCNISGSAGPVCSLAVVVVAAVAVVVVADAMLMYHLFYTVGGVVHFTCCH
jgi:hypothetical protein